MVGINLYKEAKFKDAEKQFYEMKKIANFLEKIGYMRQGLNNRISDEIIWVKWSLDKQNELRNSN